MSRTRLSRTRLSRTRLSRTRLSRTRLSRTRLSRTRLSRTRLCGGVPARLRCRTLLLAFELRLRRSGRLRGCRPALRLGRRRLRRWRTGDGLFQIRQPSWRPHLGIRLPARRLPTTSRQSTGRQPTTSRTSGTTRRQPTNRAGRTTRQQSIRGLAGAGLVHPALRGRAEAVIGPCRM
ncbi:pentapeptide repeat-containing protein [Actinosynnema sp. CS-041913]|uniref:pentapeptide repeat-containing protein n=1 Tax=Actinosynnema sp. CS-041913 TaxID=3239917 RepID=UPI003D918098